MSDKFSTALCNIHDAINSVNEELLCTYSEKVRLKYLDLTADLYKTVMCEFIDKQVEIYKSIQFSPKRD